MPSFSIALSGLQADSVSLNTIGNNLANLNTTAFKKQGTTFEDLFYQQIGTSGSNNPLQVGAGTRVSGTATNFLQGTLLPTGNSTDMALSGDGFFVVQQGGQQSLTRAGDFQLSQSGQLITGDGASVMGYPVQNGAVNVNAGLTPMNLPVGVTQAAQATQNISITANLNAGATVGTQFTTPVKIYDSLGQSHAMTVTYTKTGLNTWDYSIALPAGDATGAPVNNTGTMTFDSNGNLVSPTGSINGISFPSLTNGSSNLTFDWNLTSGGNPTITQTTAASTTGATQQDGYASGNYQGFTVDSSGVVTATFDNGHKAVVGQIAVARVTNTQGLVMTGHNNYATTSASGDAVIGVAGTGGRASIEDATLEQSNVDIAQEFSDLIVAQRSFEANSKTITAFDSITQTTLGMIR
ncbi:flagellar hook protein FlgE [Edaphobacter flagellatus]|uniref:flagellar hook protein FlgE n=1 Tax=Edaphobacter flagellatus TaxID=1933044 RepID=UPI0021B1DB8E|nr:flagellar hook protein FlgE [Edaphobacter flagellatus]